MTKFATVIIPYALTPRWAQIVIASLKEHKNTRECEIYLMDNTNPIWLSGIPEELKSVSKAEGYWNLDGVKAISETSLGENVNIIKTFQYQGMKTHQGPAGSCDIGVEIADTITKTPYLFIIDSDCSVEKDGWLDWYAGFMKDDYVAMAGLWWNHIGRLIINPCATLYNMRILKLLREEIKLNKEEMICYGENNEKRIAPNEVWLERIRKDTMGPFGEQRGFFRNKGHYVGPFYPGTGSTSFDFGIKYWHEHGNWLYNRASNQWECVAVPGGWIPTDKNKEPNSYHFYCNYYGDSFENSYLNHYWGGTSTHNFKIQFTWTWFAQCQEWALRREYDIWKRCVPEFIRKESLEKGYIEDFDTELKYALSRGHIIKFGDLVKVFRYDAQLYLMKKMPLREGAEWQGYNGKVIGGSNAGYKIMFDEKPSGEPFPGQREENGKWVADILNDFYLMKRTV